MSLKLRSDEASTPKKRSGLVRFAAFAACIVLAVFVVFSVVSSNIRLNEYEQEYEQLLAETASVQDNNDEIRRYLDENADLDEYIENMAREKLDYARPDERVYYIVPDPGE